MWSSERGRQRLKLDDGSRLVFENRGDQARVRLPGKRLLPRDHLIEHRAEREDVRTGIRLVPSICSGAMYLERSDDRALRGEIRRRRRQRRESGAGHTGGLDFANPKSSSFAPAFVSMMLPGFRSR